MEIRLLKPAETEIKNATLIKKVLWDYQFTDEEIMRIYKGDLVIGEMNEVKLKARLLNSYDWNVVIKK